jgi:hypothetical protein
MIPFYIFALIVGGGFLGLSVFGDFLGGHGDVDFGGDVGGLDGDVGLDVGHVDMDVGGGGEVGGDLAHLDVHAEHAGLQGDAGHLASKILSIRTVFYSFFGFGAVGTLLTFVWKGDSLLTAAFAVVAGVASGSIINALFGYVKGSESGALLGETSFAGLQGRVTLPIRREVPGSIVVEQGGRQVALRALPHASASNQGDPAIWKSVFVVEMEKGVARVAPVEADMFPES